MSFQAASLENLFYGVSRVFIVSTVPYLICCIYWINWKGTKYHAHNYCFLRGTRYSTWLLRGTAGLCDEELLNQGMTMMTDENTKQAGPVTRHHFICLNAWLEWSHSGTHTSYVVPCSSPSGTLLLCITLHFLSLHSYFHIAVNFQLHENNHQVFFMFCAEYFHSFIYSFSFI